MPQKVCNRLSDHSHPKLKRPLMCEHCRFFFLYFVCLQEEKKSNEKENRSCPYWMAWIHFIFVIKLINEAINFTLMLTKWPLFLAKNGLCHTKPTEKIVFWKGVTFNCLVKWKKRKKKKSVCAVKCVDSSQNFNLSSGHDGIELQHNSKKSVIVWKRWMTEWHKERAITFQQQHKW